MSLVSVLGAIVVEAPLRHLSGGPRTTTPSWSRSGSWYARILFRHRSQSRTEERCFWRVSPLFSHFLWESGLIRSKRDKRSRLQTNGAAGMYLCECVRPRATTWLSAHGTACARGRRDIGSKKAALGETHWPFSSSSWVRVGCIGAVRRRSKAAAAGEEPMRRSASLLCIAPTASSATIVDRSRKRNPRNSARASIICSSRISSLLSPATTDSRRHRR